MQRSHFAQPRKHMCGRGAASSDSLESGSHMLIIRRQRECAWRDVRCILVCPCLEMSSKKVSVKSQSWNKSSLQMRSDHSWHLRSPRTSRADGRPSKNVWRAARRERLGDETRNDTHLRIWNNITKTAQIFNHGGENRSRSRTGCALQGRHKRSLPVRHLLRN
jgi:hypothetical protein